MDEVRLGDPFAVVAIVVEVVEGVGDFVELLLFAVEELVHVAVRIGADLTD